MKYPKVVQADKRGQIVIPLSVRKKQGIEEGAAFWLYTDGEEIVLKKIPAPKSRSKNKR